MEQLVITYGIRGMYTIFVWYTRRASLEFTLDRIMLEAPSWLVVRSI